MPYIYRGNLAELERHALIEGGDSLALITALTSGLQGIPASAWRQGETVVGSSGLTPGTAIATFDHARYPEKERKQHAAFFLAYAGAALWVVDQCKDDPRRPWVARRLIHPRHRNHDGSFDQPGNSAQAYCVIELA